MAQSQADIKMNPSPQNLPKTPIKIERNLKKLAPMLVQQLHQALKEDIIIDIFKDFEDINELNILAWDITHPDDSSSESNLSLIDMPVSAGNIVLHKLTIGANLWLEECAREWFSDNDIVLNLCIVYALAYSNNPEKLYELSNARDAQKIVLKWARKIRCTHADLDNAITKSMPALFDTIDNQSNNDENVANDSNNNSYNPVISTLMHEYGQDHKYWTWGTNIDQVHARYQDYCNKQRDEAKATAKAGGKGMPPDPQDPEVIAMEKFRKKFVGFITKKKKEMVNG